MICPSCANEFLQPFLCTTCGAQKLHDHTLEVLEKENARLKAAMDRYSEDEMLLIERCAKVCEAVGKDWKEQEDFLKEHAAMYLAEAIRALKEERRKCERRVKQARQYFTENGNERSGNDRRKK
jgi:hypothetical protein